MVSIYHNMIFYALVNSLGHKSALIITNCFLVSTGMIVLFLLFARKHFFKAIIVSLLAVIQTSLVVLILYALDQLQVHKWFFGRYAWLYEYTFAYLFVLFIMLVRQYRHLKKRSCKL